MNHREAKRLNRGCTCQNITEAAPVAGVCRYGHCTEFRCPFCDGFLYGWGRMGCKCQGYVRWLWHPHMAPSPWPAAVKPSLPRNRRHRGKYHP